MAYTKIVEGRSYPHLYNVSMTVGSRKAVYHDSTSTTYVSSYEPNKRDDVMLVQYLLKRVYQKANNANPPLNPGAGSAWGSAQIYDIRTIKIDGLHGPKTQKCIEQFQLEMRQKGRNIATDGCVDSELGQSATSSISKTGYTISWLNKYLWLLQPVLAPNIAFDPECPAELKYSLSQIRIHSF